MAPYRDPEPRRCDCPLCRPSLAWRIVDHAVGVAALVLVLCVLACLDTALR
jgi:hypothetical protein